MTNDVIARQNMRVRPDTRKRGNASSGAVSGIIEMCGVSRKRRIYYNLIATTYLPRQINMRTFGAAAVVLLLTYVALPQQPAPKAEVTPQSKLLESKVRAEWEAFKNKDKKAYGDLLAEDFVAVETDGEGARNKIHTMNEVDRSPIRNYTLENFKVITAGPNAVVVTYEITMEFPPKSTTRFLRVWASELWLNREGQWKARYYQETRVK
jgi:hypothetical protein